MSKALDVLGLVAGGEVASAQDIARRLDLPRSTAHRMLAELVELRLVARAEGGLAIGPRITELAGARVGYGQLVQVARPAMAKLRDRCRETVGLHVLEGGHRILLHQAESTHEHRWVYTNPGRPMPAHAGAASKMLLAMLPEAEATGLLGRTELRAFTSGTPRDRGQLLRELGQIRRERAAVSKAEVTPGIASIAVPLDTREGTPPAVLSITGPLVRLTAATLNALRPLLRDTALRISRELVPRRATGAAAPNGSRPRPPMAAGQRR